MHATILALISLTLPDLGDGSRLGASVAIEGSTLLAGAPDTDRPLARSGAAALWRHDGAHWEHVATLTGDGREGERFGCAVDLNEDHLAVGAFFADGPEPRTGAVHVFEGTEKVARLVPEGAREFDAFGYALALDGDRLLVGAPYRNEFGFQSGVAYVFERTGSEWRFEARLSSSSTSAFDHAGISVAWCEGLALVGAPDSDLAGPGRGAVFVFEPVGGQWLERSPLLAPQLPEGAGLGSSLSGEGRRLVAGAPYADAAICWRRRTASWEEEATLAGSPTSRFGAAVSVRGGRLQVGAPLEEAVRSYRRIGTSWVHVESISTDGIGSALSAGEFGRVLGAAGEERVDLWPW